MPSSAELLDAARKGDVDGLGAFLLRQRARLSAIALSYLGHGADVEDAVQDACLKAMTRLDTLQDLRAAQGWLDEIQRNVCRGYLRERKASRAALQRPLETPEKVEERLDRQALRDWIWRALRRLPEPLRAAALLRHFGSYDSYEEIALILGIPVGTVRSRLAEARRKLSEALLAGSRDVEDAERREMDARSRRHAELWSGLYAGSRDDFIEQFSPDLLLRLDDGWYQGRKRWEIEMDTDVRTGTLNIPVRILASGSLSVVELRVENPPDDPFRCPPGASLVCVHRGERIAKMHVHVAARAPNSEGPL